MPSLPNQRFEKQHSIDNKEEDVDLKQLVSTALSNWYLFIISIIICLAIGFIYGYYTSSDWSVESKILVEDSKNSSSAVSGASGLGADLGSVFNVKSTADNEVQILKSRSLMENTVKHLQLNVRLYSVDGLKETEIYQESPFKIAINYKTDSIRFEKYIVEFLKDGQFILKNKKENFELISRIGKSNRLRQYDMTLDFVPGHNLTGKYAVSIESTDATVNSIAQNFTAVLSDKQSTTIDLTLKYPHPKKGEDILKELMNVYLLSSLENKVKIADNTISFIDERIQLVGAELNDVEQKFQQYKVNEGIADISTQSKELVSSASEYYDKLKQQEIQLRIFNDLEKLLRNPKNKSIIPSSMVAPGDAAFGQSINSYNNLLIERDRASLAYTNTNPIIENYDQQIETARLTLLRSVTGYKANLQISKSEVEKQNGNVNVRMQQVPAKERGYLDFQRKQNLKQDLFLYLLQKKEETAISKTSTISSSRIIDNAKSEYAPYKPKKGIIYVISIFLGIILAGIYLIIKEVLNVRINSKQDILKLTSVPVVGEIGHNSTQESLVALNNSRTVISEQFRSIRTKINYLLDSSKSNVILFTSSMGGEGKSFLSINLGSVLALTGKKVVFMELDLRKPKLSEIMGHDHNSYGYSNYVISEFIDLAKLIKPIWFDENCSLISSGPIPPNPTELLTNKKLSTLIQELKNRYDYVIIDCAPVGLVTDALLIEKFADITFYVVREKFTYKSQFSIINELHKNNEMRNMYIILNDVITKKEGYSSYGYNMDQKQNWKTKLFNLKLNKK